MDDNANDNNETKISSKAYNESYFMFHKLISELFIIPLIFYLLSVSYITHISTFNPPIKTQVDFYLLKKRKILLLVLIFLFIGQIISMLRVSNLASSPSSISNSITIIVLLFYTMNILAVLFTMYFIEEKSKKYIKTDKKNYFQIFLVSNLIYFLLDLVNELIYGLFTFFTPVTFCFLIYLQIFNYQNPNDNEFHFSKETKFIAITEFYRGLINRNQCSLTRKENVGNNLGLSKKRYIPMSNFSGRISMLGSDSYDLNNDDNKKSSRVNSNDGNIKINNLITKLYDPNNIDYLQNSYEDLLDIKVKFQSNFFIDYGNYVGNKMKNNNADNNSNNNDKNKPLLYSQAETDSNSDEHFDVANFYTSIIFNFNVIATSSYYVTNKNLSKSLDEFFQLDNIIRSEFTDDRYSISLINNLPKLNLKKCFEGLLMDNEKSLNIDYLSDNNNILLNCIQDTKNICENYIKTLISNPHFIIPEVLIFLDIRDKNVMQIYININKQIKKKDDLILRSLTRKEDTNGFIIFGNSNNIYKKGLFNSKIVLKILSGNFVDNNKNSKDIYDIKNYLLLISLNCEECTKFVRKKLEETIFILQEFNKFQRINNKNIHNNNLKSPRKELNSNLIKIFDEFISIYNKINGTNLEANQSFKLINTKKNENIFKKYSDLDINKDDDDIFYALIKCIENILQILINNYLDEIYTSSQIIKEYFSDFFEDYWNAEMLKMYSKYNNNSINLFKNEISDKSINNIFVLDKGYIYININYNVNVFYILFFKITTNSNFIQLEKKYEFEEVKNYIDSMKVELGLSLVWPKRCFESINNNENNIENIHTYRLNLMSSYLNKIFNANKIFNIKNWKNIFYNDKLYRDVCEIKFKENKVQTKKNELNLELKNSVDDFYINGNNTILKNKESINDKIIINENSPSFEHKKSELILKSEDENEKEKDNSIGSLNSNMSKTSNFKNLLDI